MFLLLVWSLHGLAGLLGLGIFWPVYRIQSNFQLGVWYLMIQNDLMLPKTLFV